MVKKLLAVGMIILFIGMSIPSTGTIVEKSTLSFGGKTLYVGGDGPNNYTRIQDAIDNASDGDTVFVYNGTYYEHIKIDKELTLIGEILEETIIDGSFEDELISINSSFVTIKNFTLQRSKYHTICVHEHNSHFEEIHISHCNLVNCNGMYFENVGNSSIGSCSFSTINGSGIRILGIHPSNNIWINHCFINNCNANGIGFRGSNISIEQCYIANNTYSGIHVGPKSKDCRVVNNIITNNAGRGISVTEYNSSGNSSNITIEQNQIIKNGQGSLYDAGIYVQDCLQSVIIEGNSIVNNDCEGIYLFRSSEIVINQNEISQNQRCGLFLRDASSQNLIYHNDGFDSMTPF